MKQKDILLLIVPSLILIIAWVAFSIYHNSVSSTISETVTTQIVPINPDFDNKIIESIRKRRVVDPLLEGFVSTAEESSPSGDILDPIFPRQEIGSEEGELEQ